LGAQIDMISRFKDAPPTPAGQADRGCATPNPELVMHASFRIGSTLLMASDCHGTGSPTFAGMSLSIAVFSLEEAREVYAALTDQGTILMELGSTFGIRSRRRRGSG
jgi:PhnB protein